MTARWYVGSTDSSAGREVNSSLTNVPILGFWSAGSATIRMSVLSMWVSFLKHSSDAWFTHDDAPVKLRLVRLTDKTLRSGSASRRLDDSFTDSLAMNGYTGAMAAASWTGSVDAVLASWYVHPLWTPNWERTFPANAPLPIKGQDLYQVGVDLTTGAKGLRVLVGAHVEFP